VVKAIYPWTLPDQSRTNYLSLRLDLTSWCGHDVGSYSSYLPAERT